MCKFLFWISFCLRSAGAISSSNQTSGDLFGLVVYRA